MTETGINRAISPEADKWRPPGSAPSPGSTTSATPAPPTSPTPDVPGQSTAASYSPGPQAASPVSPGSQVSPGTPASPVPTGASTTPGAPEPSDAQPSTAAGTLSGSAPGHVAPGATPPGRGRGPSRALDTDAGGGNRRRNLVIGVIAAVVVVAIVVAAILLRGRVNGGGQATGQPPSPSATPVLTAASLLTVADVRTLDDKAAWAETLTQDRVDANTPRPECLSFDVQGIPLPQATMVRNIQAGNDVNTYVLHEAMQFASVADATTAATLFTQQLGSCERPVSYLEHGWKVTGVGDAAAGVAAIVQDKTSIDHTVLLSRSGTVVHVVDAAKPNTMPDGGKVAQLLGTAVGRTCQAAGGACTDTPTAVSDVPPRTADNPEFLANADLPRITPGTGRWGGTDVATTFDFYGSQCEGKDLATVAGPQSRKHRAYLLQEDSAAPAGTFGVDEFILTYGDKKGADALVQDMSKSIDGCDKSMLTAKVEKGDTINAKVGSTGISGRTWIVTQQVNPTTKQKYRLGLVQVDKTVIYTLVPTGDTFDFSNAQWLAVTQRAGERFASAS